MARRFALPLAALMLAASAAASTAATLDFTFTFTNVRNNPDGTINLANTGTGVVTGIVRGLTDNATSAATSLEIRTNSEGYGLGEYIGDPVLNSWTLVNGVLTDFIFESKGDDNADAGSGVTATSVAFSFDAADDLRAGLTNLSDRTYRDTTDLVFTSVPPTTPVPLPAPALLLVAGLGAFALVGRRRAAV